MARRRRSARFGLTALYCGVFFPSGAALVLITYVAIVAAQSPEFGTTRVNIDHKSLDAGEFLIASCVLLAARPGPQPARTRPPGTRRPRGCRERRP